MRSILVTGAGGSIGTELCRKLASDPEVRVIAVDQCEYNLYKLTEVEGVSCVPLLADVRNSPVMMGLFSDYRPEIVYHAAALKHVPMLQIEHNAMEAIKTNASGTQVVADCAAEFNVSKFCLVSTDKAVNPVSIMGATKTWAELVVKSMAVYYPSTAWSIVRFGNVVGSSGSVIPRWIQQIKAGGPVTVTHPEMIRWFMTITEAVNLVVASSMLPSNVGGSANVYVLDMGEPKLVLDVAKRLISESGREIAITFTGVRPGEKLVEELIGPDEYVIEEDRKIRKVLSPTVYFGVPTPLLLNLIEARKFKQSLDLIRQTVGYIGDELLCESL